MEAKGHWSDHTEDIVNALPEETDNVEVRQKLAAGTKLTSMLLNYNLIVEHLNGNTCRKSTSLPVMHHASVDLKNK